MGQCLAPNMRQCLAPNMRQCLAPNMRKCLAPNMRQCLAPNMRQYFLFGYQYLILGNGRHTRLCIIFLQWTVLLSTRFRFKNILLLLD
jgi:hypothetical protein